MSNIKDLAKIVADRYDMHQQDAEKFMELGADRLGTSRIVKIVKAKEA